MRGIESKDFREKKRERERERANEDEGGCVECANGWRWLVVGYRGWAATNIRIERRVLGEAAPSIVT